MMQLSGQNDNNVFVRHLKRKDDVASHARKKRLRALVSRLPPS